jgi:hypothetical protein
MQSQKRPSPPPSIGYTGPATKKLKNDDSLLLDEPTPTSFPGSGTASVHGQASVGGGQAPQMVDPDQLSDALLSAGVDLKEEESLLSSTLPSDVYSSTRPDAHRFQSYGGMGASSVSPAQFQSSSFLDPRNLQTQVRKTSTEMGIKYVFDRENELMNLISMSCQEWLRDIITSTVELSRHRRRSRNDVHSNVAKALRNIAIKDKETEDRRLATKAALGLDQAVPGAPDSKKGVVSEEVQHRAANATALMMTSGKKKYSWLTGGSAGSTPTRPGSGRSDNTIRLREAREEPGLVLRDLLGALEDRRFGNDKVLMKGYARMRN